VDRAVLLSHLKFHKKNLELVINILLDNDFPLNMIFNKINIRIKKFFNSKLNSNTNKQNTDNNKSVKYTERKYTSIPYIKKKVSKEVAFTLN